MTLSLKNTIPTLALLVAIFMMSGCGALNSLADDAKNALDGIDLSGLGLDPNDPCLLNDAIFTNPTCLGETHRDAYNNLREQRCTITNNPAQCAPTITRVCGANFDHDLCTGIPIYETQRTERNKRLEEERLTVVINDWTDGTDDDGVVGGLNADPSSAHTNNQFLTGLVLNTTRRTYDELQGNDVLTDDQKADVFVVNNFSDNGDLTLAFEQSEIDTTTSTRPAFAVFKAADANDDDTTTTGDARDGVVFASGLYVQQSGCTGEGCYINRHYAGLLSTTDLGAPLTESLAEGTWEGWIQTRGDVSYNQRFDLTITFDEGTNGGTIDAYVTNAENNLIALKIEGVFNNQGFVTGDILHGGIASNERIVGSRSPGQLRGLIGDEGAVVAFISDATGPRTDNTQAQYSGGFVAYLVNPIPTTGTKTQVSPPDACIAANTCVDYAHWVAAASPTDAPMPNEFLKGTSGGLMGAGQGEIGAYTTIISNASRYNLEDGVQGAAYAIYRPDRDTEVHNAGILSTTNLGAPLSDNSADGIWLGTFQERAGTKLTSNNIMLTVGFGTGTGTITGRNQTFASYDIDGTFDNTGGNTGVISGTITRKQGTDTSIGVISGLIGVKGMVAVFHSNAGTTTSFVGGFLASPPAPAPTETAVDPCIAANTCVDYTHWADADAANPADAPTANRFLKGTASGLMGSVTTSRLTTKNNTGNYGLAGGDRKDGFATSTNDAGIHSVGLFSTTNLGAPLSKQTPRALWAGTLQHRVGANPIGSSGITLTITFDAGTKAGTITSGNVATTYAIDATFNHIGVIDGDITRRHAGDTSAGTVSGLIGQEGAVGVFHSNAGATTPYIGGFVASPPPPQG